MGNLNQCASATGCCQSDIATEANLERVV